MATEATIKTAIPTTSGFRNFAFYILSFGFTFSTLNFKFSSTTVESALQIRPFMRNKPNFRKAKMNVSAVLTKDYERNDIFAVQKNKPNQTQFPKGQNERKFF